MSGAHNSADETALYVIDALEGEARRRFETHATACDACAERLAAEAAAECTLAALWPAVGKPPAAVLTLPLPARVRPAEAPPAVAARARVGRAPAVRAPASHAAPRPAPAVSTRGSALSRRGGQPRGLANALAAAVITVVFMGYFTEAARTGSPVAGDRLAAGAFCALGDDGAPIVLASRLDDGEAVSENRAHVGPRMCLSDDGAPGLCREPARLCALP